MGKFREEKNITMLRYEAMLSYKNLVTHRLNENVNPLFKKKVKNEAGHNLTICVIYLFTSFWFIRLKKINFPKYTALVL